MFYEKRGTSWFTFHWPGKLVMLRLVIWWVVDAPQIKCVMPCGLAISEWSDSVERKQQNMFECVLPIGEACFQLFLFWQVCERKTFLFTAFLAKEFWFCNFCQSCHDMLTTRSLSCWNCIGNPSFRRESAEWTNRLHWILCARLGGFVLTIFDQTCPALLNFTLTRETLFWVPHNISLVSCQSAVHGAHFVYLHWILLGISHSKLIAYAFALLTLVRCVGIGE